MKDQAKSTPNWRFASRVFHERAAEYDGWYDSSPLFDAELTALRAIRTPLPAPRLEIGVGPGRFAEQLGVIIGIDPAFAALQRTVKRGIMGVGGIGEQLPLRTESVGTIFLLFTLCFLMHPEEVFKECSRILYNGGRLVLGHIPSGSPVGRALQKKKKQGNPFYMPAHLYRAAEAADLLEQTGFQLLESRSALLPSSPGNTPETITKAGLDEQAGFCILVAGKEENT
jgi:SAM-dependent methyltransferase